MTQGQAKIVGGAVLGEAAFFLIGISLVWMTNQHIPSLFSFGASDLFIGIALAISLIALMKLIEKIAPAQSAKMAEVNIANLKKMGLELTWPTIIIISLAAGICEEMLIRGGLQASIGLVLPTIVAILIANTLFTLLHPGPPVMMAVLFLLGLSFGVTYAVTGSLIGVMIGHALYDVWAFYRLRLLIAQSD